VEVSRRYLSTRTAAFRWVAGGLIAKAGFTTIVSVLAVQFGWLTVAFWTAVNSLAMYLFNAVLMDIPWGGDPPPCIRRHAWAVGNLQAARLDRDVPDAGDSSLPRVVCHAMKKGTGRAHGVQSFWRVWICADNWEWDWRMIGAEFNCGRAIRKSNVEPHHLSLHMERGLLRGCGKNWRVP
jgi:hypothetical protein